MMEEAARAPECGGCKQGGRAGDRWAKARLQGATNHQQINCKWAMVGRDVYMYKMIYYVYELTPESLVTV